MRLSLSTTLFSVLFLVTLTCSVVHSGQFPTNSESSGYATTGSSVTADTTTSGRTWMPNCKVRCSNRSDCQAGQRCCYAEWCSTQCINTDNCSLALPDGWMYAEHFICALYCTDDEDCGEGMKCCKSTGGGGCGAFCMAECPIEITPPPLVNNTVPPSVCPHTCDNDASCASSEKCYKNDCGGTQCYPVQGQFSTNSESSGYATTGSSVTADTTTGSISGTTTVAQTTIYLRCDVQCSNRSHCQAGQRCCYVEFCSTRCINTDSCSQTIRDWTYAEHNICSLDCTDDEDCGEGMKCCKTAQGTIEHPFAGTSCTDIFTECPIEITPPPLDDNTVPPSVCPHTCDSDASCASSEKCYKNDCGGTQCYPVQESGSSHGLETTTMTSFGSSPPKLQTPAPPVCPVFDPKATCGGSGDKRKPYTCDPVQKCSDGGKCCQYECEGTRCETDLCPAPNISINCLSQESRDCNKSTDCGEDKKCCEIHCGGTRCFPRAAPGALVCPNNPSIRCTPALQKRSCTGDSQCGNKKCCDTGCDALKICRTPVRQGSCPVKKVECRKAEQGDAANQCGTDMGCRGNQKCCQHPCPGFGTLCMDPAA